MTEQQIQRAVFQHLRERGAKGVVAFHVPMGGYRRSAEASIFQGLGVRRGVSDVIVLHRGRFYALELKIAHQPGRRALPTKEQYRFLDDVNDAGGVAHWTAGLDEALRWLEQHGLVIGRMA